MNDMQWMVNMAQPRYGRNLIVMMLAFTCILALPLGIYAQEDATPTPQNQQPSLTFVPIEHDQSGFLNFELEPGQTETVHLLVGNNGDAQFDAETYSADAYSIRNGGFGVRELEDERTGPTLWLDFPNQQVSLESNKEIERELTITVPLDTPPGEYVTAVVMQVASPTSVESSGALAQLDLITRTAIGVRILVPGDLQAAIEFGAPSFYNDQVTYAIIIPVANTGNTQSRPSGEVIVKDSEGKLLFTAPVEMGRVYGGHETELRLGLAKPLPDGDYRVSAVLTDESMSVHAELPPTTMVVSGSSTMAGEATSPIAFTNATAAPLPAEEKVQFLAVEATITNTTEEPVANAQLSLIATVDGEEVERFPISQSLSVPLGDTDVSTRYIPLTGWTSGEWEFELLLETVEGSGAAIVVDRVPIDVKVTVP